MITVHTSNQVYTNSLTPFIASYDNSIPYAIDKVVWNFGDGNTYIGLSANHIFTDESIYTVTVTAILSSGHTTTDFIMVSAYDLIPNSISWGNDDYKTDFLNVSQKAPNPFKIDIFNDKKFNNGLEPFKVRLYCENSKSVEYSDQKNIHLKPNWRYYNEDGDIIKYLHIDPVPLYAYFDSGEIKVSAENLENSIFVGTSGNGSFYFVDDISTSSVDSASEIEPLILTVTQNLSSHYSGIPYVNFPILRKFLFVLDVEPTKLLITQDGLNDFPAIKYDNVKTAFNIRISDSHGNFLKTNPTVESSNLSSYPLSVGFTRGVTLSSNYFDDLYFNLFSKELTSFGGYADGYFVSLSSSFTESVKLTALADVFYTQNPFPVLYGWMSDINSGNLKKVTNIKNFSLKYENISLPQTIEPIGLPEQTHSGVYSISLDKDYNAYAADSYYSYIYKYNKDGALLSTLPLTAYFSAIPGHSSPAQTVTDGTYLYVTLFDASSALKIGLNDFSDITPIVYGENQYLSAYGENSIQPTAIEISNNNLLWISYTTELSSFVVVYDNSDYSINNVINLYNQQVTDIRTNRDGDKTYLLGNSDNAWYLNICDNNLTASNFVTLSGAGDKLDAQYMTLDNDQNVWVCYGINNLLKYNTETSSISYYTLGGEFEMDSVWGGISCDHSNYIWVIHQKDKKLYIFNSNNINEISTIDLDPFEFEGYKNIYGYGDWNGFNYYNKFGFGQTVVKVVRGLYGESRPFYLNSKNGKYSVSKINENFDMVEHIKQFALTELFQNYTHFFDDFIGAIVGDYSSDPSDMGKSIYERISNFIMNNSDIDSCHIDALHSICYFIGEEIERFNFVYPNSLKRLMNLLSIKQKRLWGDEYYSENLYDVIGDKIDISTYMVSAYPQTPIIAIEKFNSYYSLIEPLYIDDEKTPSYPLSAYDQSWGWGLSIGELGVQNYYDFYEYVIPSPEKIYSIFDFDNIITSESLSILSSYDDFIKDNGVVDHILSYDLVKGLNLINN